VSVVIFAGEAGMTYDPTTDDGYVRLLINDVTDPPIFTDAEIGAFLARERGPKRAAALALVTTAANEALLSKRITTQDLATDGAAVAEALRKLAAQLRDEADQDDDVSMFGFEIVDILRPPWPPELTETAVAEYPITW
jgi:hypothetical protein